MAHEAQAYLPEMPHELSATDDVFNHHVLVQYFSREYYKDRFAGVLPPTPRTELQNLAVAAQEHSVLAFAAAQVLYMFGWYAGRQPGAEQLHRPASGEYFDEFPLVVDWANVAAAAELFEASVIQGDCMNPGMSVDVFIEERSCDVRWSHAIVLYDHLARAHRDHLQDLVQASAYDAKARELLHGLKGTPRFSGPCCSSWVHPLDVNFNAVFFPGAFSAPVWPEERRIRLPLVAFLEQSYLELRGELTALLELPREEWTSVSPGAVNAEHLATKDGWYMLSVVHHGEWNEVLCHFAPRTCELLGSRAEIVNCSVANSNIMRLAPGATLKPHFGNAPRLAVHLPLSVPEPGEAWLRVGAERVSWQEGQALVFDDTYLHSVGHHGQLPRYVLSVWFCHPCDTNPVHNHGMECPT